jgi:hypothetical protein
MMQKALNDGLKTEFRVNFNLDLINVAPDEWELENTNKDGASFYCKMLDERVFVPAPYKVRAIVKVVPCNDALPIQVFIESMGLQRLREVNPDEACKEGFGVYKTEISKILEESPYADAELRLFLDNWKRNNSDGKRMKNQWLWVFGISSLANL